MTASAGGGPAVAPLWRAVLAAAAASVLSGPAAAAGDEARQQAEQRVRLAAHLLADAATAQRIAASGQARAVSHFEEARVHQAIAEQALADADWAGARRATDEALRHITAARRLVPDAPARQQAAQRRYEQRLASVERLLQGWAARLSDTASTAEAADQAGADRLAALGLVAQARRLAEDGRPDEAQQQLAQAESHLLAGINRTLRSRTLDYSQRASTPAEALRLALDQHAGLAELLPLALAELRPAPEVHQLVERYADAGRTLRQQALLRQQRGELAQALADVHNAVLYAQRALAAAGVAMPASTDGTP